MSQSFGPRLARWPVLLAVALLILVTAIFVVEFIITTESEVAKPEATPELTADSYLSEVMPLLKGANPDSGAQLVEQFQCVACHRIGANRIAPSFEGIAERAAQRRPPLTAPAYLYESITHPLAYVVDGFSPAMPQDFAQRLTPQQLGDIIAYLLTPEAR